MALDRADEALRWWMMYGHPGDMFGCADCDMAVDEGYAVDGLCEACVDAIASLEGMFKLMEDEGFDKGYRTAKTIYEKVAERTYG